MWMSQSYEPSKPKLWLIELEQITTKPISMDVNLWYDHDKFWGEKHFWFKSAMWMSSLQAIIVGIEPLMANRTWTNHSKAICLDVNLWYDHDISWGEKHFWFKCAMWMTSLHAIWKCLNSFGIELSKPKLWLIELEQITTKPISMDVNLWYDHDKFWGEKQFWFKSAMWMSSLQAI